MSSEATKMTDHWKLKIQKALKESSVDHMLKLHVEYTAQTGAEIFRSLSLLGHEIPGLVILPPTTAWRSGTPRVQVEWDQSGYTICLVLSGYNAGAKVWKNVFDCTSHRVELGKVLTGPGNSAQQTMIGFIHQWLLLTKEE